MGSPTTKIWPGNKVNRVFLLRHRKCGTERKVRIITRAAARFTITE